MSDLLEIPDDPAPARRGVAAAAVAAVVCIGLGVVAARTFALGGFVRPILLVGAVTALPALVAAWAAAGPHPRRTLIAALAALAGVAAIPIASAGATPSPARLSEIADDVGLPGQVSRETRLGDGRCRQACSEIRRTTLAENMAFAKAYGLTVGALQASGFQTRRFSYAPGAPAIVHAAKGAVKVQLELRDLGGGRTRIASVWLADGPTPDTSVGLRGLYPEVVPEQGTLRS